MASFEELKRLIEIRNQRNKDFQARLDAANKTFSDNKCSIVAEITSLETKVIVIEIEWGDWKHEHFYADYVMSQNGFEKIKEDITEEDGSDCYSSNHYYI